MTLFLIFMLVVSCVSFTYTGVRIYQEEKQQEYIKCHFEEYDELDYNIK